MKKKMLTRDGVFAGFDVIGATIHYEPIWRAFLRRLMAQLHADGLAWAEVRFAWPLNYCREGEEVPESDYSHSKRLSEFASQPLLSGVSEELFFKLWFEEDKENALGSQLWLICFPPDCKY